MHKFKSDGEFQIAGRGRVFTVRFEKNILRSEVMNQNIEIDGQVYQCWGIEQFGIHLGRETLHEGTPAGLLVRKAK